MADRLTQVQDSVDELANQMVACLHYLNKHHDLQKLGTTDTIREEKKNEGEQQQERELEPHDPIQFKDSQKELAQDLILKEQQIEYLISILPGLTNNEERQEETIRKLEGELKTEEEKRKEAVKDRDAVLARLERVIRSIQRPR